MVFAVFTVFLTALLGGVDGTTPSGARLLAAAEIAHLDDFDRQWACLDDLWEHESRWDYRAANPLSSARGIPQALVDLHGLPSSWLDDPPAQIAWGLDYIYSRYGSPCEAWEAWTSRATQRDDGTWHGGWY